MDENLKEAFTNISKFCIAGTGDVCKDDLILLGQRLMSEEELKSNYAELYQRSNENDLESDYGLDSEDEDEDEDENLNEENEEDNPGETPQI